MESIKIPTALAARAQSEIEALYEKISGIKALVVSSIDGFDVASKTMMHDADVNKIAAMASSFAALGLVVAQESHVGTKAVVTLEAEDGYVVLLDIPHPEYPMILSATTGKDVVLAQLLYSARESIARMAMA